MPARREERRRLGHISPCGDGLHPLNFLGGERPQLSRLKTRDRHTGLSWPEQPDHRMTDGGAQPLDQVGPSLAHLEEHPGVPLGGLEALRTEGSRRSVLEPHAFLQPGQRLVGGRTLHLHQVSARYLEARVQEPVRRPTVVGEQQRALGVPVQATHGEDALLDALQEPRHRGSTLGVGQRRHHPGRLVEQVPGGALRHRHQLSVDHDQIGRLHLGAELGDLLVVDAHPAGGDEALGVPARRHPGAGEELL